MTPRPSRQPDSEAAFAAVKRGDLVRNAHRALYRVVEVRLRDGGCTASVEDGGKTGGEGRLVWLDARDFHSGGLEVVSRA